MRRAVVGLAALAAFVAAPSAPARAPAVVLLAGAGTATIDGRMAAGEWNAAGQQSFTVQLPGGGTTQGTVFALNDRTNVYLAIRVTRPALDPGKFGFWFDNDHDRVFTPGREDGASFTIGSGYQDEYACAAGRWCRDVDGGGRNDGQAAVANDGAASVYELAKPLSSGDSAHDFTLAPGATVGFEAVVELAGTSSCLPVCNILDEANFGDLVLSSAPPPVTDSDHDGIPDDTDACPTVPAGPYDTNHNGCPGPYPTIGPLQPRASAVTSGGIVRFSSVQIGPLPGGAAVLVRYGSASERLRAAGSSVRSKLLVGRAIRAGAAVVIQATKPGSIGYWGRFVVQTHSPVFRQAARRCIPPLGGGPRACASVPRGG